MTLLARKNPIPPENFVIAYCGLGDKDHAIDFLEKAYQQHSRIMSWLKVDPRFDSLRQDPRFNDLLRRVGWL